MQKIVYGAMARVFAVVLITVGIAALVGGHADERGTDEHNLRLTRARSESVRKALIERGIAEEPLLQSRLEAFIASMESAEWNMRQELNGLERVPFMVMHDGYG